MSGFASHGRGVTSGVLRRTVSTPVGLPAGLINEVIQRSEQAEVMRCKFLKSEVDCGEKSVRPSSDILIDMNSLEHLVSKMEESHSTSQRVISTISSSTECFLKMSRSPRSSLSPKRVDRMSPHVDSPTQVQVGNSTMDRPMSSHSTFAEGPVYSAFRREIAALHRESSESPPRSEFSGCSTQSTRSSPQAQVSSQQLQIQLDEARASNRILSRALVAVQRRLRAAESERDQLRTERDRFRSVLSAAQRYPFQTQQSQLASFGLNSGVPASFIAGPNGGGTGGSPRE